MNPETTNPFGARRYHAWNDQVKDRHGERVQKVSVIAAQALVVRLAEDGPIRLFQVLYKVIDRLRSWMERRTIDVNA